MSDPGAGPELLECRLTMPGQEHLFAQIEANALHATRMARAGAGRGRTVSICGAGPSLAATHRLIPRRGSSHVWACNSALPYLADLEVRVTHGFGIDQGLAMLDAREWGRTFPVEYLVASSVHPDLVAHLRAAGRRLTFFHSHLGIPDPEGWVSSAPGEDYEMWLYRHRFADSVKVGHGLNAVPRAICLALFQGYDHIVVYGADCACAPDAPPMPGMDTPEYGAWMRGLRFYADGRGAATFGADAVMAEAVIDGRRWHTRPDMAISARHLLDLCATYPDRISLLGDTLPNAIADKGPEFMARMPALTGVGRVTMFGNAARVAASQHAPLDPPSPPT